MQPLYDLARPRVRRCNPREPQLFETLFDVFPFSFTYSQSSANIQEGVLQSGFDQFVLEALAVDFRVAAEGYTRITLALLSIAALMNSSG